MTVAYQAPLSTKFSWQEHWSGLPFPSPGDLSKPRIKPGSPTLQAGSLASLLSEPPAEASAVQVEELLKGTQSLEQQFILPLLLVVTKGGKAAVTM